MVFWCFEGDVQAMTTLPWHDPWDDPPRIFTQCWEEWNGHNDHTEDSNGGRHRKQDSHVRHKQDGM